MLSEGSIGSKGSLSEVLERDKVIATEVKSEEKSLEKVEEVMDSKEPGAELQNRDGKLIGMCAQSLVIYYQ